MKLSLPAAFTRRPRRIVAIGVLTGAAALAIPTSAWASNAGDPQTTGCAASEVTDIGVNMYDPNNGAYMGSEYLRYSTACATEWVTVYPASGYTAQPSVWMQNQSGTDLYTAENLGSAIWTYQLGNMAYATACGGSQMYTTSGTWVAWEYIGCE